MNAVEVKKIYFDGKLPLFELVDGSVMIPKYESDGIGFSLEWEKSNTDDPCPVCGGEGGKCTFANIKQERNYPITKLTEKQWRELWEFMSSVYLPFVHALLSEDVEDEE